MTFLDTKPAEYGGRGLSRCRSELSWRC